MGVKQVQKLIKDTLESELKAHGFVHNKGMWYRLDNGLLYRFGYNANFLCYAIDPLFYSIMFDGGVGYCEAIHSRHPDINANLMILGSPFMTEEKAASELIDIWQNCVIPDMERRIDVETYVRNDVAAAMNSYGAKFREDIYPLPLRELARGSLSSKANYENALIYLREFDLLEKELLKSCIFTYSSALRRFINTYGPKDRPETEYEKQFRASIEQDVGKALVDMNEQTEKSLARILEILPAVQRRDIGALNEYLERQRAANIAYLEQFWPKKSPMPEWVRVPILL